MNWKVYKNTLSHKIENFYKEILAKPAIEEMVTEVNDNIFAYCPFHVDNGRSIAINTLTKTAKCFTCDKNGLFTFVSEAQSGS